MTKAIIKYFEKIGLSPEDIGIILDVFPELGAMTNLEITEKIKIVIDAGYPERDIGTLIQVNPYFLLNTTSGLRKKLKALGLDVEVALKLDPNII